MDPICLQVNSWDVAHACPWRAGGLKLKLKGRRKSAPIGVRSRLCVGADFLLGRVDSLSWRRSKSDQMAAAALCVINITRILPQGEVDIGAKS